ncbi:MAG: cupredoxin domain-containing protein [Acidobacteriota bacterium]
MIRISWRSATLALTSLALLGLAAACGGDDSTSTPTSAAIPTSPSGSNSPAATTGAGQVPAGAAEIDQDGLAFKPDKQTVKSGDKVYFKNSESALHTVTINGKNESGNMKKGDVFSWASGAAGTYRITCDFHPQMQATITVS